MSEVNIYTPRMLVAALNQIHVPRRFLLSTFFKTQTTFETEKVDIDIKKGGKDVAVYVHPLENGHLVEDSGYSTNSVAPAYTKEVMPITASNVIKRAFGEDYTQPLSPQARAQRKLGENLVTLETRVLRLEEVMAAQALINGKVVVKGKKLDHVVDFGYEIGKHKVALSGTSCWDNGGDPMFDLDDWSEDISERSGLVPNIIICGKKAVRAIIDNPKVKERLDIRNFNLGNVGPVVDVSDPTTGVKYYGRLMPSNIDIVTYSESYFNPATGKLESLIPEDAVLLGNTEAGCMMLYGLIQNMNSLTAMPRFPWSWIENDGSARYVQLESAPLPNLFQVDAFKVARVLSA